MLKYGPDPAALPHLQRELEAQTAIVKASAGRGDRDQVAAAETTVRKDPSVCFSCDDHGVATLKAAGRTWCAGRFETPSLRSLLERARSARAPAGKGSGHLRLWVLDGVSPVTDIGALQAYGDQHTAYQVASQFNCLESRDPFVTPVASYFGDPTQGPRASISAFPATLLRHYFAPAADGSRFVQVTDKRQIDLLADVCERTVAYQSNGYLTTDTINDPAAFIAALEANFDLIRVGVHDRAQVVLGYNWDGSVEDSEHRLITQVFTSTFARGGYEGRKFGGPILDDACRYLLRAAYLGTLLAAVTMGRTRLVLTLIGGGAFGNPHPLIWESIQWALAETEPLLVKDIDVVVNGYNLQDHIDRDTIVGPVRARGGVLLSIKNQDRVTIHR